MDLHCLHGQGISVFSKTRVKEEKTSRDRKKKLQKEIICTKNQALYFKF